MDVRIEAAAMAAEAHFATPVMQVVGSVYLVIAPVEQVASFSRLSIGGCSLSAVSPDHINYLGGLASAA